MPRLPAQNRLQASGRKIAINRKTVGFINDGKLHVVLDTNVPINAIWALSKKELAEQVEKDCLQIIQAVSSGKLALGINARLMAEYQIKAQDHLKSGKLSAQSVGYVLGVLSDSNNLAPMRMLVDPQRYSKKDEDDDLLFDGLSADYLISDNTKHVGPHGLLPGQKSTYATTIKPSEFVRSLLLSL